MVRASPQNGVGDAEAREPGPAEHRDPQCSPFLASRQPSEREKVLGEERAQRSAEVVSSFRPVEARLSDRPVGDPEAKAFEARRALWSQREPAVPYAKQAPPLERCKPGDSQLSGQVPVAGTRAR
jgi:hypothetical protein